MACDLETTQSAACASGIGKVTSPIQLWQLIAQLTCEAAEGGGGGGGSAIWGDITGDIENQTDLWTIILALQATAPTAGSGSPEGVVTGSPGKTYFDTVGESLWVKQSGTGNTGWYNY